MRLLSGLLAGVFLLVMPGVAQARMPWCEKLTQDQSAQAEALHKKINPYDCCDDTIKGCMDGGTECSLVFRLANDVCRQVAGGVEPAQIERAMDRRAQSMVVGFRTAKIAVDPATLVGDPEAPVTLVMYACATCPYCSVISGQLYDEIRTGTLKGKVKLYYRYYPLRNHEKGVDGGLAMVAAARMNKFWPFVRVMYPRMADFNVETIGAWAEEAGLDREKFEELMKSPEVRQILADSRREGMGNRVGATPAFYINGRQYTYDTELAVMIDVLTEEYERVTGGKAGGSTEVPAAGDEAVKQ